ncbi:hypothetical protein DFH09DRAFT_1499730 [Mycena vulgaris]|nr:hypothetical protein DFH09DRAFT_1499730 [Mycena vulgaris]
MDCQSPTEVYFSRHFHASTSDLLFWPTDLGKYASNKIPVYSAADFRRFPLPRSTVLSLPQYPPLHIRDPNNPCPAVVAGELFIFLLHLLSFPSRGLSLDYLSHPDPSRSRNGTKLQPAASPSPTRSTTEVDEATNLVSRASGFDSDLESAYPDFQNEYGDFPGDGAARVLWEMMQMTPLMLVITCLGRPALTSTNFSLIADMPLLIDCVVPYLSAPNSVAGE